MTHLNPEDLTDALEGVLTGDRAAHAASCELCRAQLDDLRGVMRDVAGAGGVPQPSPVFWDVLQHRVRTATAAQSLAAPTAWRRAWKPIVALGAMAATAVLALLLRQPAPVAVPDPPVATIASAAPTEEDYAWDFVVGMAADLSRDDVHDVAPAGPATAVLVEDMTPRERAAFVKLIQREMGGLEW